MFTQNPQLDPSNSPTGDADLISYLQEQTQQGATAPQVSSPAAVAPTHQDPMEALRKKLAEEAARFPSGDSSSILRQKLGLEDEAGNKITRKPLGKIGNVAGNILQILAGRNFSDEASKAYQEKLQGMKQGESLLKNEDLNDYRAQMQQRLENKDKQLADISAAHDLTKKEVAKLTNESKERVASEKNAIETFKALSKDKTEIGKLKLAQAAQDFKEKNPNLNLESILAGAYRDENGDLDIEGFSKSLSDIKKASRNPVPDRIITTPQNVYNSNGDIIGQKVVPTVIPRTYGGVSTGSVGGSATPVGQAVPAGANSDGTSSLPTFMQKDIEALRTPITGAKLAAQNLLQDLGSGKLDKYSGWLRGSDAATWLREQGYTGDTSSGEAVEKFLGPTNVIQHIRSLAPRLNETEIREFTKAIGSTKQKGATLAMKAILYNLSLEMRLKEKLGQVPSINGEKITDSPYFSYAIKDALENTIKQAKAGKGVPVKVPDVSSIFADTASRAAKAQSTKTEEIKNKLKELIPPASGTLRDKVKDLIQ